MSMGMRLGSGRAGIKLRPFFLSGVPYLAPPHPWQTQRTSNTCVTPIANVSGSPNKGTKALAPWLRSHSTRPRAQQSWLPASRPPPLDRERDCPDRAGDYTANPGLRPESMNPSLRGRRRGGRMEPEGVFLPHPRLTRSREHKAIREKAVWGCCERGMAGHGAMGNRVRGRISCSSSTRLCAKHLPCVISLILPQPRAEE